MKRWLRQLFCFHTWVKAESKAMLELSRHLDGMKHVESGLVLVRKCSKCGKEEAWFIHAGGRRRITVEVAGMYLRERGVTPPR